MKVGSPTHQGDKDLDIPSGENSANATPTTSNTAESANGVSGLSKEERRSTSQSIASSHTETLHKRHSIRASISGALPFKHARHELIHRLHLGDDSNPELALPQGADNTSKHYLKKKEKREGHEDWHEKRSTDLHRRLTEIESLSEKEESPEMRARFGRLPVNNYGGEYVANDEVLVKDLTADDIGKVVTFRARIHNVRKMSSKLVFLVLRQQLVTIQGLLAQSEKASGLMLHWLEHLPFETILRIKGLVQTPQAKQGAVINATIHDKEIVIHEVHVVATVSEPLPFTVAEAEVSEAEALDKGSTRHVVGDRARQQNRILDLRSSASHAIFRVQSSVCNLFRIYLDGHGFMEIHSPKLQGGATESGASVFKVNYFDRIAFLAQSPQLAKQMSVAADFGKVYEVGAVFRAENSNTHRHLTEYTGLDIEMAINKHYHEVRNMIDATLKTIFKGVYQRNRTEIELIKRQFPHEDLVWLDQTPMIPFKEAITMLNETGWLGEDGKPLPLDEDLGTRDEIQLGRMMKDKFKTDYYIIDKFPASARPFYTMPDPHDPTYTNSFDIFVRGQEIVSGGQRIHDAALLVDQMKKGKIDPKVMEEYMQGFDWAAPPHGGAGIGLERLLMLLLQLGDIRHSSMYPRDPKSLPAKAVAKTLRHPEADTLKPPKSGNESDLPQLEKLIANYGDASNTSWLEPRFKHWRDPGTGAAVGYVPHQGYSITVGDPLCDPSQYQRVIANYLYFIKKETTLKPLWLLCGQQVEDLLASKFDYRTFTCVAEQRVDLTKLVLDSDVQRKLRHAAKEGVKMHDIEIGTPMPDDVRAQCDKRIKDWLGGRKSHQHVHLTDVHPWQDVPHRQYHYATDADGTICVLIILAQLSTEHGWQVKFSLDFPGSPSGAVEMAVTHALKAVAERGAKMATFGAGATNSFTPGNNLKGTKVKMLSKAYHTIATELKLTAKSEFREKLGAKEDPVYVCYPPKGLGPKGVHAILSFFED